MAQFAAADGLVSLLFSVELLQRSWSEVLGLSLVIEGNESEYLLFLLRDIQLHFVLACLFLLNGFWHAFHSIWALRLTLLLLPLFPIIVAGELMFSPFEVDLGFFDQHLRHLVELVSSFIVTMVLLAYVVLSPDIQNRYRAVK